jgi:hypothetical protein
MTEVLTSAQEAQMEADLARLLPDGIPNESPVHVGATRGLEPGAPPHVVNAPKQTGRSVWRMRRYPMGGWVYWQSPAWMQRIDQGQDFEIPLGRHIIAPNWGKCIHHLSDGAFPNGFGSPYAVVYIGAGPFGRRLWYIGHVNAEVISAGATFHTGRILGRPNHSLNWGRGWTELGHAANGYPMAMGEGAKWHHLFVPVWKWSRS